jgi:protein associated with RNAse G/E
MPAEFGAGDVINVRALHADGQPYRSWQAVVEHAYEDCLVTLSLLGSPVNDVRGDWITNVRIRGCYWFDRLYNLAEGYGEDGTLCELYANVAAPPVMTEHGFDFTDHELDVQWRPDHPAQVIDEDEFAAAVALYGYTPEFQAACRAAAMSALQLIETWQPAGSPAVWPALRAP